MPDPSDIDYPLDSSTAETGAESTSQGQLSSVDRQADAQQEPGESEQGTRIGTTGKVGEAGKAGTESKDQQKRCCVRCGPICNFVTYYRRMSPYEQLAILLNALTLVAIVGAGVIYFRQLRAMQSATEATQKAAEAATG